MVWVQLLVPRALLSVLAINYVVNALVVKGVLHAMAVTFQDLLRYAAWATVLGYAVALCLFVHELMGRQPVTVTGNHLTSIIAVPAP